MPFPFLQLPPEIRNKVYRLLLVTGNRNKDLAPDVVGLLARNKPNWSNVPDMADSLGLLRICKLVNQEASAVLYGRNNFVFDDSSHQGKSLENISTNDFLFLYPWLVLIGEHNRMRLRWIEFTFTRSEYLYCRGEWNLLDTETTEHNDGRYLIDAIALLAKGHALTKIVLDVDVGNCSTVRMLLHLFRPRSESQLIRQLEKISGLEEFAFKRTISAGIMELYPVAHASFQALKVRMEAKQPVEKSTSHAKKEEVSRAESLVDQMMALEALRKDLHTQACRTNLLWKRELAQVQAIDNAMSKFQVAIDEILEAPFPS